MVAYRKLPSGLWQASVSLPQKLPNGKPRRMTKTHPLKGVVRTWGTKLESQLAAGQFTDPRSGDMVLADWHAQWCASRLAAGSTIRKDDSHWRVHVKPRWGGYPLNTITRQELRMWVIEMVRGNIGPPTVRGAVTTLSSILHAAVDAELLASNPAAGLKVPRVDAKPVFWWTHDEAAKLLAELDGPDRLMVDLDLHCGLRLGELLGLRRQWVDLTTFGRLQIQVVGVQTRDGWREYPKSVMSRRTVPVPPHLRLALIDHAIALPDDAPVFAAPGGAAWDDRNWARRVFEPALVAAGVRRGTPHDMRHTAASWLVQAGVDLYRVQALLGHESFRTTQRYAHLAPESFDKVIAAWEEMSPWET
jgi:integrase